MIKRKAGRPAKQKRQQRQKKTKIIQKIAAISVNEDHEPGIPINDVESLMKQFWKDSGTDEFDAEALEVSELDLKKIIEEWKHDMELKNYFSDVRGAWLWLLRNQ